MKAKTILSLVVVLAGLLASTLTPQAQRRDLVASQAASSSGDLFYALVIGNSDYASLPKLLTAAADARAVERSLREYYGFQTRLLVNVTRSQIVTALSDYRRELSADASLLIYYAGHGHSDAGGGKTFWLPVDATLEDASKWIAADELTNVVRAVPARHVIVVSDSCYSGTLRYGLNASPTSPQEREQFLQKTYAGRSRTLMASGSDEPFASEDVDDGGHSVFAAALLRGLRKMEGPSFTASELFAGYVLNPVAGRTGRIAVYNPLRNSGHEGGDFVFKRIKPAPAPGSCDDLETKAKLYETFLKNSKGSPEQQKDAYDVAKDYISKYEGCPKESDKKVIVYIRAWMVKWEKAVADWERWRRLHP